MRFPTFIAFRYIFSKKSQNVINIITGISMFGIGIGALALIVVLSAFNGLETLVESLYSSFDPDIKITATKGKTIEVSPSILDQIIHVNGVDWVGQSLEETAVIKYKDQQTFAAVKGVDDVFIQNIGLDSMMYDGNMVLKKDKELYAILGYGIADQLSVFIEQVFEPVHIYAAKRLEKIAYDPSNAFKTVKVYPSGIFAINPDFDYKYVLVHLDLAKKLFDHDQKITALELGISPEENPLIIQSEIQEIVGEAFTVKSRFQQNEILYKTNKTEKWITFLILSFILIIATFNMIGTLIMIIIDKKQDIFILKSMGADKQMVKKIFLHQGILISFIGGVSGIVLGLILTLLQQYIGLVPLSGVIVEYYPMELRPWDFIAVFTMVMAIGFLAAWLPANIVSRRYFST